MLSVIIPVFNAEKYIKKCVLSILSQDYKNIECLLIDDGSKDDSESICKRLVKFDTRVRFFQQENQGVSSARNTGIVNAKGKYIMFVDADDWLETNTISQMMAKLVDNKGDIIVAGYLRQDGEKIFPVLKKGREKVYSSEDSIEEMFKYKKFGWEVWDKIYKAELLKGMMFDSSIKNGEDLLYNWKVFRRANRIVYSPIWGYRYMVRENTISTSFSKEKLSIYKVLDIIYKHYKNNRDGNKIINIIEMQLFKTTVRFMMELCFNKKRINEFDDLKKYCLYVKKNVWKMLFFDTFDYKLKGMCFIVIGKMLLRRI